MPPHGFGFSVDWAGTRRFRDERRLPFHDSVVQRRVSMHAHRQELLDFLVERDIVLERRREAAFVAVVELAVGYQYDHTKHLGNLEREQVLYWMSQGTPSYDLWFFRVCRLHRTREAPLREFHAKRFQKVYTVVEVEAVRE